ncbi:MAG: hypothetical protein AAB227_01650 [Pseudomonadota bacterium]
MWTVSLGALGGVSASLANQTLTVAQAAVDYWSRYVDSSQASLEVQISFVNFGDGTLAQGGTDFFFDFAAGGFDYYAPSTVIELLTGTDSNGSAADVQIEVDVATLIAGEFSFGPLADGVSTGGSGYDLWTVLVHEIGHALGFISNRDVSSTDLTTFDQWLFTNAGGAFFFDGPITSPIFLAEDLSHLLIASVMQPSLSPGEHFLLSTTELAMFADVGVPLLQPTAGADSLSAGLFDPTTNSPQVDGLAGDDTIRGLPTDDRLLGNVGNDSLSGSLGLDELIGGAGYDTLLGGDGDDLLDGGDGADSIDGGAGADTVTYLGSASPAIVLIGSASPQGDAAGDILLNVEHIIGSAFADTITGDNNANRIEGFHGADLLDGGGGNDTLIGGSPLGLEHSTLIGGAGADLLQDATLISYISSSSGVSIDVQFGQYHGGDAEGDQVQFQSAETRFGIVGSGFSDTLAGFDTYTDEIDGLDGDDRISGRSGDDILTGDAGNDTVDGGGSNDQISGGAGFDLLTGGNGNDTVLGGTENDTLSGGKGFDFLRGEDGNDSLIGDDLADTLIGGNGRDFLNGGIDNDRLFGDAQHDTILGDAGDDVIDAGTGNDSVDGGGQRDSVFGGSGFDLIDGGNGNDTLTGGTDGDTLNGGAGFDVLQGDAGDDVLNGGASNDVIFGNGGNDTIIFEIAGGTDTLRDFTSGAASEDVVSLVGFGAAFDSFSEVIAAATQTGAHVTIDFGNGDALIIRNTLVSALHADDFTFG